MWFVSSPTADGPVICRLSGDLDANRAAQLRHLMSELVFYPKVVIDLGDVRFLDSAGLGALIGGLRRIRKHGGRAAIGPVGRDIARLLDGVGLERLVPFAGTIEKAAEAVADPMVAA
jgi:anti-sigma B factor antagonist